MSRLLGGLKNVVSWAKVTAIIEITAMMMKYSKDHESLKQSNMADSPFPVVCYLDKGARAL